MERLFLKISSLEHGKRKKKRQKTHRQKRNCFSLKLERQKKRTGVEQLNIARGTSRRIDQMNLKNSNPSYADQQFNDQWKPTREKRLFAQKSDKNREIQGKQTTSEIS